MGCEPVVGSVFILGGGVLKALESFVHVARHVDVDRAVDVVPFEV